MPADLTNPFGPSCCDGGECSIALSTQPCGCDPGINWLCSQHAFKEKALTLITKWRQSDVDTAYDAALSAAADELEAIL